ncbi:hypothetical protein [Natrinema altunense]|uniref:Uncharacterized protein n=1 Tax=Natrinema altunense TaxID=222984 RepID=A0A482XU29_9EURY|nr:hypothetical protein [Natrinema altunense]RZH66761.1 hypothetical protein ELS17_13325 [Natrinema altunense]
MLTPDAGLRIPALEYRRPLLETIENGEIDPSFVSAHQVDGDGPEMDETCNDEDGCLEVVTTPRPIARPVSPIVYADE